MGKKRKLFAIGLIILLIAAAAAVIVRQTSLGGKSKNLALRKGVKATCDSVETEALSADKAIDGDDESLSSRWSSENNWEDASHYIELEFPEEISVSFVVLKWERTNAVSYQLEGSSDGEDYDALAAFDEAPQLRRQEIVLSEAADVKFLRLSINEVSKDEENYSNLYQNVSLYEFEVYADKPAAYYVKAPEIGFREDGGRCLEMPDAPEGYSLTYLGADYEQVIGADCEIYENIQDKEVVVGYRIENMDDSEESQELSFTVLVPAWDSGERESYDIGKADAVSEGYEDAPVNVDTPVNENAQANVPANADISVNADVPANVDTSVNADAPANADTLPNGDASVNQAPTVIPTIAEWAGAKGIFEPGSNSRIIIEDESLMQTAELFATRYHEIVGYEISVAVGSSEELKAGDFYLAYGDSGAVSGVGDEGYVCDINDACVIKGIEENGIYFGTITVLQILKMEQGTIPQGIIRDYPKYKVRGFGIDVARKPVSLAMLYQIAENMSWYKMNDLSIHLNDNVILSTSGLTDSFEETLGAYSAFRIDTSVTNKKGERLTSEDYSYTAEEFAQFISTAKTYGVRVVPEIDTPAHSLSITKLFPEYALRVSNETADQIDLSKKKAVSLIKDIWQEVLAGRAQSGSVAAFDGADIVNIGMDEYYGDGEAYRRYMNEIIELVRKEGKVETVRLWGSLSNMDGRTKPSVDGLQMNIWSDVWADPVEMYEEGYSLINMQNNHLYIIPGGGYDYLDAKELYENWEPNKFYDDNRLEIVAPYSPRMLGAAYMIWNDMSGSLDVGICEADLFDRFFAPLGVISGKLWGGSATDGISYEEYGQFFDSLSCAPGTNPYARKTWENESLRLIEELEPEASETVAQAVSEPETSETASRTFSDLETSETASQTVLDSGTTEIVSLGNNGIITLQGKSSYVETGYTGGNGNCIGIGGSYSISFEVYRQGTGTMNSDTTDSSMVKEQILFETDSAYGTTAFKAVQAGSGKVGFSREGRDYSFDYTLPEEEWVKLTVRGEKDVTSLYVDGQLVDTLGDSQPFSEYATFVFPLERIGSRTDSFCGMIRNIEIN